MIIAVLPKKDRTFSGIVGYNTKKEAQALGYFNTSAKDDLTFRKELEFTASFNARIKDPVFHAVLSLAPDEKIDREMIKEIAQDYLDQLGYANQPFAIYEHFDKSHKHFHIVTSRVELGSGKKINDSFEFERTNKINDALIYKYDLQPVLGLNTGYGIVNRINETLTYVLKKKPHSFTKLSELCQISGISIQKSKQGGIVFFVAGYKKGINSGELDIFKKGKSLQSRLSANKRYRNTAKNELEVILERVVVAGVTMPLKEFRLALSQQEVRLSVSRSDSKVNGMLFYYKGFEFKGSDIADRYAWGSLGQQVIVPAFTERKKQSTEIGGFPPQREENKNTNNSTLVQQILRDMAKFSTRNVDQRRRKRTEEEEDEQNLDRD